MSPELLHPGKFGLENSHPTVQSDLYALGMVVYEVLSGQPPFAGHRDPEIVLMVVGGKRPERPQGDAGELFTDEIWNMLELCWKQRPSDRPTAKHVLMALRGDLSVSWPPSDMDGEADTDTDDEQSTVNGESEPCTIKSGPGAFFRSRSKLSFDRNSAILEPSTASGSYAIPVPPPKNPPKRGQVRGTLKKLFGY